jgi:predicted nucleotidyltransferase
MRKQGEKKTVTVIEKISDIQRELAEKYTVKRIGVFGSFARGDEKAESDVDILVELVEPTFDHYMDLKFRLEEVLQRPVDLVLEDTIKKRLKSIIEREVVYA